MEYKENIVKTITNKSQEKMFLDDVLLYELNDLSKLNLDSDISIYISGRHKNDLPTIYRLGRKNKDVKLNKNREIISDSLTIIGNDSNALVISFLGGKTHLITTKIQLDRNNNIKSLKVIASINKILLPNESFETEKLEVYKTNNVSLEIEKNAIKKASGIKVNAKKLPSVYCTWYYYGNTINEEDINNNLKAIKDKKLDFDVFQIDDGWEDYPGKWDLNKKFNCSLTDLANKIKNYNLIPGIWTSPFTIKKESEVFKIHPEWVLKNKKGNPCIFHVNKQDFYVLDVSNKNTWSYLENLYKNLTSKGFTYHKIDFTRAFVTVKNPDYYNKNNIPIECYRNALLAIRKGIGNDSYFSLCGGLFDSAIGIVDIVRTSSDVISKWKSKKGLPFTIKQNLLRYYMNNWWFNDPDALMLRHNKKKLRKTNLSLGMLNENELKTASLIQLISGGIICNTDPLDSIEDNRLNYLRYLLPCKKRKVEIVNIMSINRYPNLIRLIEKDNRYIVIINYDDKKDLIYKVNANDFGLPTINNSKVFDFFLKKDVLEVVLKPHESTILKLSNNNKENDDSFLGGSYV